MSKTQTVKKGDTVKITSPMYHYLEVGTIATVEGEALTGSDSFVLRGSSRTHGKPITQIVSRNAFELVKSDKKTKNKIKMNDRVKIRKDSEFYYGDENDSNPKDVEGHIIGVHKGEWCYDVQWDNGKTNNYTKKDLELADNTEQISKKQIKTTKTQTTMINKQQMKDAVEQVANQMYSNGQVITTLPLKNELRKQYPAVLWNQYVTNGVPGVSDLFHELVAEGKFRSVADNGTYQTYVPAASVTKKASKRKAPVAAPAPTKVATQPVAKVTSASAKLSRTKALDLMKNNKGHFFTAVYTKKDGTVRTINCQYVKDQLPSQLGYVQVKEAKLLKSGDKNPIRNLNLQTLDTLKIAGTTYKVG